MIDLGELNVDKDIYPRLKKSNIDIVAFCKSLEAGAKFPPILVQKVRKKADDEEKELVVILDGIHRFEAHKLFIKEQKARLEKIKEQEEREEVERQIVEQKKIDAIFWRKETLDFSESLEALRIKSAQCNLKHGVRLGEGDLKFQALRIVEARPIDKLVGIVVGLAKEFGITKGHMSSLIGTEVNRRKQSRDAIIYGLLRLGWTQEEVGKMMGLKRSSVEEIDGKFDIKLYVQEYKKGLSPETIASNHNLAEPVLWNILLDGKSDLERFSLFGKSKFGNAQPKISDHWMFAEEDSRMGKSDYDGREWGQAVMNILYHFSKQGDLVVDPMAGGGVVSDACLIMNRRCRSYDIQPEKSGRKDIKQNDIKEGYPKRCQNCDLIILDPPYFKKKEEDYQCQEFTKNRKTFLANMKKVAVDGFRILKQDKYFALLYGQYLDYENELDSILTFHLDELFEEAGFKKILNIQEPLKEAIQYRGFDEIRAKEQDPWQILPISRDWSIFRKV